MKKIAVLIFLSICTNCFSNYTTPGTGVTWDLDSLVTYSGGNVTFSSGDYLVNDTIIIAASDTLKILQNSTMKFGTSVFIDIFGVMISNPSDSVTMTAKDTTLKFLGLKFEDLSDGSVLKRTIFEYGNSIRMLNCDILIDSCIIRYNTLVSSFSSGAISFFGSNTTVSNCKIFRNRRSAFISGVTALNPSSPKILNNLIYENNVNNENYPQINLSNSGPGQLIIRGNTISGLFIMAGGISLSCLSGSIPDAIIENNIIKHNRYGIAILNSTGTSVNVYINNNILDSNNIQNSPALGGSGINFNGIATQKCVVTRNIIRGNLWGITIQGTAKPNMGDLSSSDTSDAGLNEIYNNKNTGQIYDLYNNTVDSVKAENNYWGTGNLDSIEAHIFHKNDNPALGLVDFIPIRTMVLNLNVGLEGLVRSSGRMGRKDTVTVYLRDTVAPYAIIDSAKNTVDTATYLGIFSFTNASSALYYIVVKHFNSIETWSRAGGEYLNANISSNAYSFITASSKAYGNNTVLTRTRYCDFTGDVDQNGIVNELDLIPIFNDVSGFVTGDRLPTDLTGDGLVDLRDLLRVHNNITLFVRVISPLNP